MKKLGLVGVLAGLAFAGVVVVALFLGSYKKAVGFENNLRAFENKAKNQLSTLASDLQSQGVVSSQYTNAVFGAIQASSGRYGNQGVRSVFFALKEANIPISDALFTQWAQKASALWSAYQADQNTVIDEARRYRNWLGDPTTFLTRAIGGFPRVKLEDFENITITQEAADAYQTRRVNPKDIMTPK